MLYLLIAISILIIGIVLYKYEKNSFINGSILSIGLLLTIMVIVIQILKLIYYRYSFIDTLIYILAALFLLTIVFLAIYCTILMYKKEGRGPTLFMFITLVINIFFLLSYSIILNKLYEYHFLNIFRSLFILIWLLDLIFTLLFILYLFYSVLRQVSKYKKNADYIIVLGAGITSEKVTPLLKSRLDKGLEYYRKSKNSNFIVSGGQGDDEPVSEAYAMAKYLRSEGVYSKNIILEDKSTTTYENMLFSKKKILEKLRNPSDIKNINIIFTTNNYHVFRASIYARKAKIKAHGIGAPTAHYFLPNALIREFIALLLMHKGFSLFIALLCIMIVILSFLPI